MSPLETMRGPWRSASKVLILVAAQLAVAPAAALQILQATDHAELSAEVSSTEVNRIALEGDRIARVVQSAGGFTLEHDPVSGDLYLYPGAGGPGGPAPFSGAAPAGAQAPGGEQAPVTLYVGSEKGLTFRLRLIPVERDSAQILIRSVVANEPGGAPRAVSGDARASAIAAIIGAVARREPLPGYAVVSASNVGERPDFGSKRAPNVDERTPGTRLIETWRGPRFTARVLQVYDARIRDASVLAAARGTGAIAAWLSGAAHGNPAHGNPADSGPAHGSRAHGNDEGRYPAADNATAAHPRLGVVVEAGAFHEAAP